MDENTTLSRAMGAKSRLKLHVEDSLTASLDEDEDNEVSQDEIGTREKA